MTAATGIALPDAATESTDPIGADGTIETAVARLRTLTRDKRKSPSVFRENRNFGYERNLLAVRSIGLWVSLLCVIVQGVVIYLRSQHQNWHLSTQSLGIGLFICAIAVLFWLFVPSKDRAWAVGRRYAEQLLDQSINV